MLTGSEVSKQGDLFDAMEEGCSWGDVVRKASRDAY